MKRKILIVLVAFLAVASTANAQKFALKTNLLYDAVTAVNFAVEVPFEIKEQKR